MHLVRLNLAEREPGRPPNPLQPAVSIDGQPIKARAVTVIAEAGQPTRVTITIDAAVEIDVLADVAFTYPPDGMPPTSDTRLILAAIERLNLTMTDLTQAEADEAAAVGGVIAELQKISGELTTVSQQLTAALASGDQAAAQKAADQLEASAKALAAATTAAQAGDPLNLAPPPPPPPPPAPPVISPTSITGQAGVALSGSFTLDPPVDGPVTWTATDVPPDFSIASDGTISGTPAEAEAGDLKVSATDATGALISEADVSYSISAAAGS